MSTDLIDPPAVSLPPEPTIERRSEIHVDDSRVSPSYANFARVTGTPEEVILDFGLNPQPTGIPVGPIALNQRVICNYYTAKRILAALTMTIQRHEGAFGVLETDIQKRVQAPRRSNGQN